MTYIWAHRGASGSAPENTIEAFQKAIEMQAEGIELDVQLSKDGQLVVCHDETIDRCSNQKGFIKDYTLQQLESFNFNNHHPNYLFCKIPTLKEVFELIQPTSLVINIELKTGVFEYPGIEEKVVDLVKEYGLQQRVVFSSFNHYSVLRIKQLLPEATCGFLHADKFIDMAQYTKSHHIEALHPFYGFLLDQNYVLQAKENGLLINAWTLNDKRYIAAAIQLQIHAVITNYPDEALKIRAALESQQKA